MRSDHRGRLARAAETAGSTGVDALIVAPSADLVYLAGYDPPPLERLTCLIVRPGADPVLILPRLEAPLASGAGVDELADLRSWGDTEDPYALVQATVGADAARVACSHRMWASHLLRLQAVLPEAAFVTAEEVMGRLRSIKDAQELDLLKRAARYADEALGRLLQTRLETRSERDVARALSRLLLETGNDEVTFTIVGSGPNGASPHHEPGTREIHFGEAVVMDFGGRTDGYCSDVTRTVAVGEPPRGLPHVHEVVLEAQEEAFRTVAPDVPAQEVDRAARRVIERAGYGELFMHRTGHGIGLEEHEWPYIVEGNDEPLRPGMCFSIEPGIYLPGEFGVRIEDIVMVTGTGAQRLNHVARELQVVR
ncbi:MAG TPA: Xaa-Pro peptidase family protein [Actinomycetota bacterium]|nr:Xaa-Pro peptidase family protein [Actinomycetota bacterium]